MDEIAGKIHDISILIDPEMPIYPGDPTISFSETQSIARGDKVNVSSVCFGAHTGTHIDAPFHVDSNAITFQNLALGVFIGPAWVFAIDAPEAITAQDLAGFRWEGVERVLFKTLNSRLWDSGFSADFVYLDGAAARFLAQNTGVRLVGIDYLSIEKYDAEQLSAHKALLEQGIVILEGLNLSRVAPGEYNLVCLPLKLDVPDGSPARAILIERT